MLTEESLLMSANTLNNLQSTKYKGLYIKYLKIQLTDECKKNQLRTFITFFAFS